MAATGSVPPPTYEEKDAVAVQWITQPGEYRPIVANPEADLGPQPTTIPNAFDSAYGSRSDDTAITTQPIQGRVGNVPLDKWGRVTCAELYDNAYAVARWLLSVGLEPHDVGGELWGSTRHLSMHTLRVAVIGESSVRERYIHFGTLLAGGVIAHISHTFGGAGVTSAAAAAAHINARVVFCDIEPVAGQNVGYANAVVEKYTAEGLPLPTLVTQDATHELALPDGGKTLTTIMWDEVVEGGDSGGESDKQLEERKSGVRPADVAVMIVNTSLRGSGVSASMLSHDNLLYTASRFCDVYAITAADRTYSYLPLGHVIGMLIDVYAPLVSGAAVFLASSHACLKNFNGIWKEIEPTYVFGPPRMWEKVATRIAAILDNTTGMKKMLADWALNKGKQTNNNAREGKAAPWGWGFANTVVQTNVRTAMGLSKCRLTLTGGAPLGEHTEEYFLGLDVPLLSIFGDEGVSGFAVCATPGAGGARLRSVGKIVPGTEVRILDPHSREPLDLPDPNYKSQVSKKPFIPEGVLAARGRHVFLGYYDNSERSAEKIDSEGFYHTHWIAKMDNDCFVFETNHVRTFLATAGSTSPTVDESKIEGEIVRQLAFLDHVCVVSGTPVESEGVVALLALECEPGTTILSVYCKSELGKLGCEAVGLEEAVSNEALLAATRTAVDKVNDTLQPHEKITDFAYVPAPFTRESGELDSTSGLVRHAIVDAYKGMLSSMLGGSEGGDKVGEALVEYYRGGGDGGDGGAGPAPSAPAYEDEEEVDDALPSYDEIFG